MLHSDLRWTLDELPLAGDFCLHADNFGAGRDSLIEVEEDDDTPPLSKASADQPGERARHARPLKHRKEIEPYTYT